MQALKLADFLADKHLDVIYSSPFKRAIDTAQIVASKYKSIDILTDECLSEIAFGFWNIEDAKKQEKMNENYNKIRTCLEQIVLSDEYKNVAISSHGGVTRALCFVAGVKIGMIENCQCFHFLFENGEWKYMEEFSTDIKVNNGAKFITVYLGNILTMPGLSKEPNAVNIDLVDNEIVGLF